MYILGAFGPWQIIFILVLLVVLPAIILTILFVSRAKHKAKAQTLDKIVSQKENKSDDTIEKLEKLNRLRESGGLSEEEYAEQKKKLL